MSDNLNIEHSLLVEAPNGDVWDVLTGADTVPRWLGCLQYQPVTGHVFYMQQDDARREAGDVEGATHCEILTLEPPSVFAFSWFLPDTPATRVRIQLDQQDEGTVVTLLHDGWEQFDAFKIRSVRDSLAGGWKFFALPNLKRLVETGA